MSKAKFAAVQELVAQKKYTEARLILKTIENSTASEWEARLAILDPNNVPDEKTEKLKQVNILIGFAGVLLVVLLIGNMFGWFLPPHKNSGPSASQATAQMVQTSWKLDQYATQTAKPTFTPEPLTPMPGIIYYARRYVTVRSCPSDECSAVRDIKTGDAVVVLGAIEGKGSIKYQLWYKIRQSGEYESPKQYINSEQFSLSSTPDPTATAIITAMPPTTYYAKSRVSLYICPYLGQRCDNSYYILKAGDPVIVVGFANPKDSGAANGWYAIQIPGGDGKVYYQLPMRFTSVQPAASQIPSTNAPPTPDIPPTALPTLTASPTRHP